MADQITALLSHAAGGPESLRLGPLSCPAPGPGEVRVRVKAVGVNYPDVLIIADKYQFRPPRPFAPGAEIAGLVEAVGPGVSQFAPGARVMAMLGWGGMAEAVNVPAAKLFHLPDAMPFDEAAAFLMTYGTARYALGQRGALQPGEWLLVTGAGGGVGLAAVELGRAMGARVIATASSDEKLAPARALGCEGIVTPTDPSDRGAQKALSDQLKALTGGAGVDVVCDNVGGPLAEAALRAMARGGRFLVVGFPAGIPSIPLNLVLLKEVDLRGIFWGAAIESDPAAHRAAVADLLGLYEKGAIRPRIHARLPLAEGGAAIAMLSERQVIGKVVVTI